MAIGQPFTLDLQNLASSHPTDPAVAAQERLFEGDGQKEQNGLKLPRKVVVSLRQIAPLVLALAVTVVGTFGAHTLGQRDARSESEHRAEIAATEIHGRIDQGAALADSLRRFMAGAVRGRITNEQFASIASRWLSPVDLTAAAWIEQIPASRRAIYERRIGRQIVVADRQGGITRAGPRASYLPATLVTGIPPMTVPGLDLASEPGVAAAIDRPRTLYQVTATSLARPRDELAGFFLVQSAQRLTNGTVQPGYVALFVPESWLRAAVTGTERLELRVGGVSSESIGTAAVRSRFTDAGARFDVLVPLESVAGAAAVLPWIILAGGLVLVALAGVAEVYAARRAKAKAEVDRLFTISSDLIVVAGFDGYFRRVNPAFESQLGYTQQEALERPFLDFVHPDDRLRTNEESQSLREGQTTISFVNRYVCKDGSHRWIEWTATPVLEERLTYAVGRDVTERRQTESKLREAEERHRVLAEAQAALRRVATLVARGASPGDVFAATTAEAGRLLHSDATALCRYEADGTVTVLAADTNTYVDIPIGTRFSLDGENVMGMVLHTGGATRRDSFEDAAGDIAEFARRFGIRSSVGAPVTVEGRRWGVMVVSSKRGPLPGDTERRLVDFTDLVATAIANTESRAELTASRARVVAASDEVRRLIERDLHDGAQQQLLSLALEVRAAQAAAPPELSEHRAELSHVAEGLTNVVDGLREIALGIHPGILAEGGLGPALKTLARRSAIPVELDLRAEVELPERVEVAVYYVVSEALTNAAKHSHASVVHVAVRARDDMLNVSVHDDGLGGADPTRGSGLLGLKDRAEALGGTLSFQSARGAGTSLHVELPLDDLRH
jgi:PAS domain S-box-containing protein